MVNYENCILENCVRKVSLEFRKSPGTMEIPEKTKT